MEFNRNVLDFDVEDVAGQLVDFIRDQVKNNFRRKGVVIGLSGGIDSAVAGALCVRALGPERVFSVLLPERDSNPISREYGRKCGREREQNIPEDDKKPVGAGAQRAGIHYRAHKQRAEKAEQVHKHWKRDIGPPRQTGPEELKGVAAMRNLVEKER